MNSTRTGTGLTALPLCYYGHPALERPSTDIQVIDEEIELLAEQMILTMYENEGIGLAAPQIARNINLLVLSIPTPEADGGSATIASPGERVLLPRMPLAVVNPVLADFSVQTSVAEEGCLSIPSVRGPVERPEFVELHGQLIDGHRVRYNCGGLLARCLQHECDHLCGKLFIDRVDVEALKEMSPKLRKLRRETLQALRKQRKRRG